MKMLIKVIYKCSECDHKKTKNFASYYCNITGRMISKNVENGTINKHCPLEDCEVK